MDRARKIFGVALAVALVALVVGGAAAPARAADDRTAQAKQYFEAGKQAYEAGQYSAAAIAFEQAYAVTPLPPIAFSLAQAYRKAYFEDKEPAKLKRAVELYRTYLQQVKSGGRRDDAIQNLSDLEVLLIRVEEEQKRMGRGPIADMPAMREATQLMVSSRTRGARAVIDGGEAAEVPVVRETTAGKHKIRVEADGYFPEEVEELAVEGQFRVVEVNLKEMPAKLALRTESGAELAIDGRPVGSAPFKRPVDVAAGKHFVSVTKRGHYAFTRELTLERGKETKLAAPLETTRQRVASYWVLGGAGLLAIGGGVTTFLALQAQSDAEALRDKLEREGLTVDEAKTYEDKRARRDEMAQASYVLYGSALVVAVTGVLLYFVDSPRVEAPQQSGGSIVPIAGPEGVGAAYLRSF